MTKCFYVESNTPHDFFVTSDFAFCVAFEISNLMFKKTDVKIHSNCVLSDAAGIDIGSNVCISPGIFFFKMSCQY